MGLPFDDETLDELAKTNPDLVAQYRAKMQAPKEALSSAQDVQDYGTVANAAGRALTAMGNANRPDDVILHNRMDQLGKTPTVSATPKQNFDDKLIDDVTARGVARAKENQANEQNTFNQELKLHQQQRDNNWQDKAQGQQQKDWDVTNARNNATGPQADSARLLLRNSLLAKANEAEASGDPGSVEAAAALRDQAKTAGDGMGASDIMAQHAMLKDLSYDKILDAKTKKSSMEANNAYKQSIQDARQKEQQAKAVTDMRAASNSFRGNAGAQQASRDELNAQKALDNIEGKDPNSLTTQDLRLLATAMAKIESGGVGGEHGTTELMPNNLKTEYAKLKNFVLSEPTDAAAGEYVRKNMGYLRAMQSTAQKAVNDVRRNSVKGWKGRVPENEYNDLMGEIDASEAPREAAAPAAPAASTNGPKPSWAK